MATESISTIKSSGGDYTSVSSWEAGEQGNLVTADEIAVAEIYDDWSGGLVGSYPTVDINGWTHDSTHYCVYRAASGHEYDRVADTGAFLVEGGSDSQGFVVRAGLRLLVQDLGITFPTFTNQFAYSAHDLVTIDRCAVFDTKTLSTSSQSSASKMVFRNTFIEVDYTSSGADASLYKCTLQNSTVIQKSGAGSWSGDIAAHSCVLNNTAIYNANTKSASNTCFSCTGDYNAQNNNGSSAPPGANSINTLVSGDFEDYADGDYHAASGSTLIDAGENKYSDYTHDIDGDEWPSSGDWDIGADYYVAGGGITLTVADSTHSQGADNVALVQASTLSVQESTHAHAVDNVTLATGDTLIVQDATHSHSAEAVDLIQANILAVDDALHTLVSDNVALAQASTLSVNESTHSQAADNIDLLQANTLSVSDALHSHSVDNVVLSQAISLIVAAALHNHLSAECPWVASSTIKVALTSSVTGSAV